MFFLLQLKKNWEILQLNPFIVCENKLKATQFTTKEKGAASGVKSKNYLKE